MEKMRLKGLLWLANSKCNLDINTSRYNGNKTEEFSLATRCRQV